jgi:hypothetical protein
MSESEDDRPLADRRHRPEVHDDPGIGEENAPSPTDPANMPEQDPSRRVYGEDEGFEKQTEV